MRDLGVIQKGWAKATGHIEDGQGPMQAVRWGYYTNSRGKTELKPIPFVVDLAFAALIIVDELHAAGGPHTLNYVQIIDPFRQLCHKNHKPSVIGITGSPLASGISVVLTFAEKALQRHGGTNSSDAGLRALAALDTAKYMKTWDRVEAMFKKLFKKNKQSGKSKKAGYREAFRGDREIAAMFNGFAAIMQYFFVARDYTSVNPWREPLSLINSRHIVQDIEIEYQPEYHSTLRQTEETVQSAATLKWRELVQEWEEGGQRGDRPVKPALAKADPKAYHLARILAVFPNLLNAINAWQESHPDEEPVIGPECTWGDSVGGDNKVLQGALASLTQIRNSFLWDIAEQAVQGSAKWDHVCEQIHRLSSEYSEVPHPVEARRSRGDVVRYRSKYVVVTSLRLEKAILWCRLVQCWGKGAVVMASNSADRINAIPIWRQFYNEEKDVAADTAFILVAGLSVICQSVTLVEGHVLEGLEPTLNNGSAVQVGNRQYRIGQQHPEVHVNWLVHKDSLIERRISDKNKTKNQVAERIQHADAVDPHAKVVSQDEMDIEAEV
jgi:hypothetical protein